MPVLFICFCKSHSWDVIASVRVVILAFNIPENCPSNHEEIILAHGQNQEKQSCPNEADTTDAGMIENKRTQNCGYCNDSTFEGNVSHKVPTESKLNEFVLVRDIGV